MRLTFVIPTLNEAQGIRQTIDHIPRAQLTAAGHDVEVLVVDGPSTDGTREIASSLGARVLVEPRLGYGRAYKTGLKAAQSDLVVTCDADGTYPLDLVPQLLERFRAGGLDFATVNRFARLAAGSMGAKHRFGNWVLSTGMRTLFGVPVADSQSGMWILTRAAIRVLPLERLSEGMAFSQEIKIEAFKAPGVAAAELPGGYSPRVGQAKLASWRDGLGNLRRLVGYRRRRKRFASGRRAD